ncbi:MAG: GAF domain-containing sensor histidine kinase [Chloroflexota bacterium]|nr:GAF domain-containing sensor histidine kinase [Chloroflexota bacterium]
MSLARPKDISLRVTWVVVTLLALTLLGLGVPERIEQLLAFAESYQRPLRQLGLSPTFYAGYVTVLDLVVVLAHVAIAALILWHRADDRTALLVAVALVTVPLSVTHAVGTGDTTWRVFVDSMRYLGLVASVTLLYLFPDGRFISRWSQWLALLWAVLALPAVFLPNLPISLPAWPSILQWAVLLSVAGGGVYAQLHRYAHVSSVTQRAQTHWAVLGLTAAALAPVGYFYPFMTLPSLSQISLPTVFYQLAGPSFFILLLLYHLSAVTLFTLFLLLFPLSFAVAILRYRLWEIDLFINRSLVYGALTASVVGLYVLLVGTLASLLQTHVNLFVSVLATGLIAVLFDPLRQRLQRSVDRLMYGERGDPHAVLAALGQRLEGVVTVRRLLPTLVETVAHTLKLPYVAIALRTDDGGQATTGTLRTGRSVTGPIENSHHPQFEIVAASGMAVEGPVILPLIYHGEIVGQLVVGPRTRGEALHPADWRLLETVAHQAGAAVYTVRLTVALQRSREQLVVTREEERRRLRRDLHDGLGPQLASLTLKLDAARNLLLHNPTAAERLLVELKAQTQGAIADIRRLVYDLRPPALDQLGLVPALREYAASENGSNSLCITITAPDTLPPLPAAVEVAAYRIVLEALTNAKRHAHARTCQVRFTLKAGMLYLEITDDGRGLGTRWRAGVGLTSMRERAEELGGSFRIKERKAGGTVVQARLPLRP